MLTITTLRRFAYTTLLALAALAASAGAVQAGDCHSSAYRTAYTSAYTPAPKCYYKCITTYEYQQVAYQKAVVKYDHCYKPYVAYVTCYKTIRVPVKKYVKVCH